MAKKEKKQYSAQDLLDRIRTKYSDGYKVLAELRSGTGYTRTTSYIDAAVFSLWPSQGLYRQAIEIKVSRSDLLRELQNPEKNAWAREVFHEFWYCLPEDILKDPNELPMGSGILVPYGSGLKVLRQAQRTEAPLPEWLLAAIVSNMTKSEGSDRRAEVRLAVEADEQVKDSRNIKAALDIWARKRGFQRSFCHTKEEYLEFFESVTSGEDNNDLRNHLTQTLEQFRLKILNCFMVMGLCASHTLDAVDETGSHVISLWGGEDKFDREKMKAIVKQLKSPHAVKQYKRLVEMREMAREFVELLGVSDMEKNDGQSFRPAVAVPGVLPGEVAQLPADGQAVQLRHHADGNGC